MNAPGHPHPAPDRPLLGAVEWFRPGEHERVEQVLQALAEVGIERLRTGVSWADCHRPEGRAWTDWLLPRLARTLEVVPCVTYTPPSLGLVAKTSAPPRDPKAYADFLDVLISEHGSCFEWIELWNEANNLADWDWRLDPQWQVFSTMILGAAHWVHRRGKRTVLAGMCPTDPNWLAMLGARGVLAHIDAIGLHAFPGTWQHDFEGWPAIVGQVRQVLARLDLEPELWITEVGYSTWRHDEVRQLDGFLEALQAPVDRVYWYAAQDLDPELESQEGFHVDERHYHFGLLRADGAPKLLHRLLRSGGAPAVQDMHRLGAPALLRSQPRTVITGGAGFVGTNLADRLARQGETVLIYDNLSRPGVERNALWLKARHGDRIAIEAADVREPYTLRAAARQARELYHLAAQVAVTTSIDQPVHDFEVNARGTLNLLEAARRLPSPPTLIVTSTNKVYGRLAGLAFAPQDSRYEPLDPEVAAHGIGEDRPLDLCSPYGCSKGAGDQYVLDYARIYGLPAIVFRMSCIYGPHQLGTEDQGWVAHFLRQASRDQPITIFGDGKQVRDLLFVDDLIDAFLLAQPLIPNLRGQAFNVGGGPRRAISLREVLKLIEQLGGRPPRVVHAPWRPSDQVYYVSDVRAFTGATGWRPSTTLEAGMRRLWEWLHTRGSQDVESGSIRGQAA